ncbi:MAG: hypothetical protein ACRD3J_08050 [Thermoanaerobaculia bacterium]
MAEKDDKDKDNRARGGDDDSRSRRDARDAGDSVRESGRSVRRASNDFLTFGCDLLGDLLTGAGEALTPRRRSSRSSSSSDDDRDDRRSNCFEQFGFEVRTYNRSDRDEDDSESSSGRPARANR